MNKNPQEIRCPLFLIAAKRRDDPVSGKPIFSGFYLRVVTTRDGRPAKLLPIFTTENDVRLFSSKKTTRRGHAARFDTFGALCPLLDALKRNGVELVCFDIADSPSGDDAPHMNINDVIRLFSGRRSQ